MANLLELSQSTFSEQVLQSPQPVLVDFWAPWCGPCRMIGPIIEQLAEQYAGRVKVAKVNVDDCPGLATSYGVSSIPTLIVFKGGEVVDRLVGVPPKSRLESMLDEAVGQ